MDRWDSDEVCVRAVQVQCNLSFDDLPQGLAPGAVCVRVQRNAIYHGSDLRKSLR
jgi:hypothetical protein